MYTANCLFFSVNLFYLITVVILWRLISSLLDLFKILLLINLYLGMYIGIFKH